MNAMRYFERVLNDNIVAALEGKYFKSLKDLLSCAIREEKKIMMVQQAKNTRCINLFEDIATRIQAYLKAKVPFVVGSKQASTPRKKKGYVVTNCESIEANAECAENKLLASRKSFVVQQKEKFVPQVDTRSDMVIDHSTSSSGTTYPSAMAAQKFSLDCELEKNEVSKALSNDCLKSEHKPFGDVAAHTIQNENRQCHEHLQTREIIESKKEAVATDLQSGGAYFVQREHEETFSQVQILRADIPTSSMPFSSAICDEIKCCNVIDSSDIQQGDESVSLQDLQCVSTPIFEVAYNMNEMRDQMFGLSEDSRRNMLLMHHQV
jgi:hypothetical protein